MSVDELRVFLCAARGEIGNLVSLLGRAPHLVRARDTRGASALHHAAFNGHEALASLLLQRAADPNARSLAGSSPLHLALRGLAPRPLAARLLAHGASALAADGTGAPALALALARGDGELAALIGEATARESVNLDAALTRRRAELDATTRRLALLRRGTRAPCATRKVVVLGLSGAGKTAFCLSAASGGRSGTAGATTARSDGAAAPTPAPTAGIAVRAVGRAFAPPHDWSAALAGCEDDASLTLELVDVGGGEEVRAYWPRLLDDDALALVLFAVDASERDASTWEMTAAAHGEVVAACARRAGAGRAALPVLTIASKVDLAGARAPGEVEAQLADAERAARAPTQSSAVAGAGAVLAFSGRTGAGVREILEWAALRLCPAEPARVLPRGCGPVHELRRSRLYGHRGAAAAADNRDSAVLALASSGAVTARGGLRASSSRLTLVQQVQRFASPH